MSKCSWCKVPIRIICRNEFNDYPPNASEDSLKFQAFPAIDDIAPNAWCESASQELGTWIGSMRTSGRVQSRIYYPLDPQYDDFFDMITD